MRTSSLNWFWAIWNWFSDLIRFLKWPPPPWHAVAKHFLRLSLVDTLNQVSIESKALGDQVFTIIAHLVEIRV